MNLISMIYSLLQKTNLQMPEENTYNYKREIFESASFRLPIT